MNSALNLRKNLLIFGLPILIIGIMIVLAKSSAFTTNPQRLLTGITIDLILTVPGIFFLLSRKTSIPKTTVVLFMILGMVVCTAIIH